MKKWRLTLIFVGRTSDKYICEGCDLYEGRIRRDANLDVIWVREERISARGKKEFILRQEGQRIREKLRPGAFTVALDEKGKLLSSEALARSMDRWSHSGGKEIAFILGGPYGLEDALKEEADFRLSLSPLTLTHGMARIILTEQIYRAFTLLRGEPYHK